jgi:hypothetical protein
MAKNPLNSKKIHQVRKQGSNNQANTSPISEKVGIRRQHYALEEIVRSVS